MTIFLLFGAFFSAALSATVGMAGGLLLMGLLGALLPVGTAMALHGLIQLLSNGVRAGLLRQHISAGPVLAYAVAGAPSLQPRLAPKDRRP